MTDDEQDKARVKEIRAMLNRMAGVIPSTPPLPMTGRAAKLRDERVADARAARPSDMPDLEDDEIWDRLRGQPIPLESFLLVVGTLIDTVDDFEKRIIALENPKQPWEKG